MAPWKPMDRVFQGRGEGPVVSNATDRAGRSENRPQNSTGWRALLILSGAVTWHGLRENGRKDTEVSKYSQLLLEFSFKEKQRNLVI